MIFPEINSLLTTNVQTFGQDCQADSRVREQDDQEVGWFHWRLQEVPAEEDDFGRRCLNKIDWMFLVFIIRKMTWRLDLYHGRRQSERAQG